MARALTAMLTAGLFLAACSPPLLDGQYTCADGRCPSGWFCHADQVCRRAAPGDAGADAAPDAAVALLSSCTDDTACGALRCNRGPEHDWPTGRCVPTCTMDRDCLALPGSPSCDTTGTDLCVLFCDELDSDCPSDLRCVAVFRESRDPTTTLGECRPPDAPIAPSSDRTCADDLDCGLEELCAETRCARPCARGVLPCAVGETCVPSAVGDVCRAP